VLGFLDRRDGGRGWRPTRIARASPWRSRFSAAIWRASDKHVSAANESSTSRTRLQIRCGSCSWSSVCNRLRSRTVVQEQSDKVALVASIESHYTPGGTEEVDDFFKACVRRDDHHRNNREWDVNPHAKGLDRGGERIVAGERRNGLLHARSLQVVYVVLGPGR
jgi:hypothetical protein